MRRIVTWITAAVITACLAAAVAAQATGENDRVQFPATYTGGVHYATVTRGGIREELFTSPAAIEAVKAGQSLPSGTVITMEDYRAGQLFRYVVMEKRRGWGANYPPSKRNGEWEFQAFNADKSLNRSENLDRCFSCHKGQETQDFVFTRDRMRGISQ
jgi:hypothetical protein